MDYEIVKITKAIPKETTLPDGYYTGSWCGSVINLTHKGTQYELFTKEGVRGRSPVIVRIENGNATFNELQN